MKKCHICGKPMPEDKVNTGIFLCTHQLLITVIFQSAITGHRGIKARVCSEECAKKFIEKYWRELMYGVDY